MGTFHIVNTGKGEIREKMNVLPKFCPLGAQPNLGNEKPI